MQETARICLECNKTLKGRVDKKFCDDLCRNAYNNKQNSDQNNYVRNINNILRRNRRILEAMIPQGEGMFKCPRRRLTEHGFNFRFFTHQYINKKGDAYFFCYEFGYLPMEHDWALIVKRKEENV